MLRNWRVILPFALVVLIVIWIQWWASLGFPLEHEICSEPKAPYDCGSYNIIFYSAWALGKAVDHWSALITAVATGFVAWFTWTLWHTSRQQGRLTLAALNLARAEFLATHRPKIRIKHVWLKSEFAFDSPIRIKVVCVNIGTANARFIDYGVDILPIRSGRAFPAEHEFRHKNQISTVLGPGISGPFPELVQSIDQELEIAVRTALAAFYCIGYLHYMDSAGNVRTTAFCRKLLLDDGRSGRFILTENSDYEYED
jgi:hypothetical protein